MLHLSILFSLSVTPLLAIIVPANGNTAPSRVGNTLFPATDVNNEMRGFGVFEAGMTLGNGATSCLFTDFFPVSGVVDMRGGQLNLQRDLYLDSSVSFAATGTISGTPNSIFFPEQLNFSFADYAAIPFITAATLTQPINSVGWSFDSQYVAVGRNIGSGAEIYVYQFNGSTLSLQASAFTTQNANAITWHPSQYYFGVSIMDDTSGPDFFVYQFTPPTTLTQTDNEFLTGSGLANAWNPRGSWVVASTDSSARQIILYTFSAGNTSVLTDYTFSPVRNVQHNAMSWDSGGRYLAVGVANSATMGANELNIFFFNDTTMTLTIGADIATSDVTAVDWSPTGSFIAVGLTNGVQKLRVYMHDLSTGTLTDQISAYVGETLNVLSVDWSPNGDYLAVGLQAGGGTQLRVYQFDKNAVTLTILSQITWSSDINSISWSPNSLYLAVGDSANILSIYYPVAQPFTLRNVKLKLHSNLQFNTPIVCSGTVEIDGTNFNVDLSNMQYLTILNNSSLSLKNMVMSGIVGSKINMADSTGVLQLSNMTIIQNGDFNFNNGAFVIDGSVLLTGTANFIYSSSQTSTIQSNATLSFDSGMTFSYAPSTISRNLIQLIDQSSTLNLLNTTLISTTTGLQLTKGTLIIDGQCPVISNGIVQNQGIMFGDGNSSANNLILKILPESGINLNSGFLIYNNV